jgi:hypothetical protein
MTVLPVSGKSAKSMSLPLIAIFLFISMLCFTGCRRAQTDSSIRLADQLAAHPADITKPKDVPGVSDDSLRSAEAIEPAVTACVEAIKAEPQEPRYRFELGRVLLVGGMPREAREHLEAAAQKGHAGAYYYLGQMELNTAKIFFQKAADAKFSPSEKFVRQLSSVKTFQPDTQTWSWMQVAIITTLVVAIVGGSFVAWRILRRRRQSLPPDPPAAA